MTNNFESCFSYKLIYVFEINDEAHKGLIKIGEATLKTNESIDKLSPNCKKLNIAARERIDSYTNTAGIGYNLLYTELAVRTDIKSGTLKAFRDHNVHRVLVNSGFKKVKIPETKAKEWFKTDLNTAINAIDAVKKGKPSLSPSETNIAHFDFIPRPEQDDAITQTKTVFKHGNRMLWNCKMRYGKTLTSLELIRQMEFSKTIIITHRPVVESEWRGEFTNIFYNIDDRYTFGSKAKGDTIESLVNSKKKFIYFDSIQDLRGSCEVNGKFEKNSDIFSIEWDFLIVDEAHEGTTSPLGKSVINALISENTKILELSGTPFNILRNYDKNIIYTWDYIKEQDSKLKWDEEHFGDSNPYSDLPTMKIYVYDLGKLIGKRYIELEDKAFNFHEFFRVWTGDIRKDNATMPADAKIGDFVHADDVRSFLNLITKEDEESKYPFSSKEYRDLFKHSLWMVPGVKEAKALKEMMEHHPIFGSGAFNIVNVAGSNDEEAKDAKNSVVSAIEKAGDEGYTITLSCGKLTTGVTIKEWNAVFMLAGSFNTSASSYLQTIFRVQSPCNKNGQIKDTCYVFDFAPDRTLKMVAESVALSTKAGKATESDRIIMGKFLNYCPVISIDGTSMREYKVNMLLQQLKRAYAERAVQNGFDDAHLYNDELLKLSDIDLEEFNKLKGIIGATKAQQKTKEIDINKTGFTDEEYEEQQMLEKKPKKQRTPEEQAKLDELNEKKKNRNTAISILRGISIRMPLLIYGANIPIGEDFKLEQFLDNNIIDEASWAEFMPEGVTRTVFKQFMKYYDQDIFISAGRKIRNTVMGADELEPTKRVQQIAMLFSCFKNPDKETVLTPWRVVNMHMSDCLGGYSFYQENPPIDAEMLKEPRYVDQGEVTSETFSNKKAQILEINSKTGLYPLYVVYSIFKRRCSDFSEEELTNDKQQELWAKTVSENIFVICKTQMAKHITKRTLVGYRNIPVNAHYFDDLINMMQNKQKQFIDRVKKASYWKREGEKMKFDAVVGNPPYQETIGNSPENSSLSKQLFPSFIMASIALQTKYVSLITPSRWFTADAQDKSFLKLREFIKNNNHIKRIFNYRDERDVFTNVLIAGGVNYFLYDKDFNADVEFTECSINERTTISRPLFEEGLDVIIPMNTFVAILNKVKNSSDFTSLMTITYGRNAFGIVGKKTELDRITKNKPFDNCVSIRCAYEQYKYTSFDNISKNPDLAKKWKVLTSKGNGGAGILNFEKAVAILGKAFVSPPYEVCTDSLIPIGNFDTEQEAINLQKYMSTKFLRFMVGIMKTSQNIYQVVYRFVPLLDFTDKSDIDWTQSIADIDNQLYKKYNLSEDEVSLIDRMIKTMDQE